MTSQININGDVSERLRRILESGGQEVFETSDGDEGISEFPDMFNGSRSPQFVITDIFMPTGDGYKVIAKIREVSPGAKIMGLP